MERVRDREKFGMALEFLPIRKDVERRVDDDDELTKPSLFSSLVSDDADVAGHLESELLCLPTPPLPTSQYSASLLTCRSQEQPGSREQRGVS